MDQVGYRCECQGNGAVEKSSKKCPTISFSGTELRVAVQKTRCRGRRRPLRNYEANPRAGRGCPDPGLRQVSDKIQMGETGPEPEDRRDDHYSLKAKRHLQDLAQAPKANKPSRKRLNLGQNPPVVSYKLLENDLSVLRIYPDAFAFRHGSFQDFQRQRVLNHVLNGPFQGTRPVCRIEAGLGQK